MTYGLRVSQHSTHSSHAGANAIRRELRALDCRTAGVRGEGVVPEPADPVVPLRAGMLSKQQDRDGSALPLHDFADPREKRLQY